MALAYSEVASFDMSAEAEFPTDAGNSFGFFSRLRPAKKLGADVFMAKMML
jgi:hypothetical protein